LKYVWKERILLWAVTRQTCVDRANWEELSCAVCRSRMCGLESYIYM
jgi:hypothetical protein